MKENLWHLHLGHPSTARLKALASTQVISLSADLIKGDNKCLICTSANQHTQPIFKKTKSTKTYIKGEKFYTDLCEPVSKKTPLQYFITFRDKSTKYIFVSLIAKKSETNTKINNFLTHLDNQFGIKPKIFHTD